MAGQARKGGGGEGEEQGEDVMRAGMKRWLRVYMRRRRAEDEPGGGGAGGLGEEGEEEAEEDDDDDEAGEEEYDLVYVSWNVNGLGDDTDGIKKEFVVMFLVALNIARYDSASQL